jgi:holo-[acyl-carrier protein] synthase
MNDERQGDRGAVNRVHGVIGVGIDLIQVDRVADLLARKPAVEARLFTEQEAAYCRSFAAAAERFAARVAAKEAVAKALGIGIVGWRDVEVLSGGKPRVRLAGKTRLAARELGVRRVELSLTHTASQAAAIAVALGDAGAAAAGAGAVGDAGAAVAGAVAAGDPEAAAAERGATSTSLVAGRDRTGGAGEIKEEG